jgi:membrane protease YdiL (CAAX protease family)
VGLGFWGLVEGLWLVTPFIVILTIARAVEKRPRLRRALGMTAGFVALVSALLGLAIWFWGEQIADPQDPKDVRVAATLAGCLLVTGLLTLLCLIRRVRARLFPRLGVDSDSAVHTSAAVMFVLMLALAAGLFLLLLDEPGETILLYLTDPLISLLSDIPLALVGVGFLMTRDLKGTLARLDFRAIGARQVGWTAVMAVLFLIAVGLLDYGEKLWLPDIHALENRFPLEFVNVSPFVGALLVSLAAGVGEEAVFRGALQPRFGLVPTALLFASAHVQYQVPGVIVIFFVGVALGIIKERTSTTFTACVHMFYDIGAFLLPDF